MKKNKNNLKNIVLNKNFQEDHVKKSQELGILSVNLKKKSKTYLQTSGVMTKN